MNVLSTVIKRLHFSFILFISLFVVSIPLLAQKKSLFVDGNNGSDKFVKELYIPHFNDFNLRLTNCAFRNLGSYFSFTYITIEDIENEESGYKFYTTNENDFQDVIMLDGYGRYKGEVAYALVDYIGFFKDRKDKYINFKSKILPSVSNINNSNAIKQTKRDGQLKKKNLSGKSILNQH